MVLPSLPAILAWLVIFIAIPLNWAVVIALLRLLHTQPENRILRDRFIVAAFLATVVTIFGAVFVNNDLVPPPFTPPQTMVVTRLAILALAIPAIYWLVLYRTRARAESHADQDRKDREQGI